MTRSPVALVALVALAALSAGLATLLTGCPPPAVDNPDAGPPPGATLHVRKGGDGHGVVKSDPEGIDCDNLCTDGQDATFNIGATKVSLTATAARDALFAQWSCEGTKNNGPLTTVTVEDATIDAFDDPDPAGIDLTCTATFRQLWTIQIVTSGSGTGHIAGVAPSTDGTGTRIDCPTKCTAGYFNGDSETLTATADPGNVFTGWKLDCQGTDPATLTLDADKNCEAHFCPDSDPSCQ